MSGKKQSPRRRDGFVAAVLAAAAEMGSSEPLTERSADRHPGRRPSEAAHREGVRRRLVYLLATGLHDAGPDHAGTWVRDFADDVDRGSIEAAVTRFAYRLLPPLAGPEGGDR